MNLQEAIKEIRKTEKRKFDQSIDLLINMKGVDLKRDNISVVFAMPHQLKEKKICAFLNTKSDLVKTVTPQEFVGYKDKNALKNLVKDYDAFIGLAPLMPQVATVFGKALGPSGKMPSPQLGIIMQESEAAIKNEMSKISKSIKIRAKEPSIKLSVGKESMSDEDLIKNIETAYNAIVNVLPTKKENVRSVMLKLTMEKPLKVEMK